MLSVVCGRSGAEDGLEPSLVASKSSSSAFNSSSSIISVETTGCDIVWFIISLSSNTFKQWRNHQPCTNNCISQLPQLECGAGHMNEMAANRCEEGLKKKWGFKTNNPDVLQHPRLLEHAGVPHLYGASVSPNRHCLMGLSQQQRQQQQLSTSTVQQ